MERMKSLRSLSLMFALLVGGVLFSTAMGNEPREEKATNLFEYGGVTKCEDNLENLFRNFPIFIENGKDIDFRKYEFVGVVKNKRTAKKFVKKNFKNLFPINWTKMTETMNEDVETSSIRYHVDKIWQSKSELKEMMNTVVNEYVHIGDEVYVIHFVDNLKKYEHYVFINPETKKIVLEGNIFGIELPMAYVAYKERDKKKD
ncbi:MAG: hypothetical protein QM305_06470 [Bacteroidota bacterium]|nr:hypothetical protein [Bacteroidota bacterium]